MYIHMYMNNPTSGTANGTLVSEGTGLSPISVTLNATNNEVSSAIKLALRCDTGYNTVGSTTITPTGTSASSWDLAPDNSGVAGTWVGYGNSLTVSSIIGTTNTIFWVRAKSVSSESPINDSTVDLVVSSTIAAV